MSEDLAIGREDRRRISIGDLAAHKTDEAGKSRTRIAIEPSAGVVDEGALQTIEQPFLPGTQIAFSGHLRVTAPAKDAEAFIGRVAKGLAWITQFGALRSVGYGIAKDARLSKPDPYPAVASVASFAGASRVALRLTMCDPFCVGETRIAPNAYMSAPFIPGGAIKGAIANQILAGHGRKGFLSDPANQAALPALLRPLAAAFSNLRVSHALPAPTGAPFRRPNCVPLSLAHCNGRYVDCAGFAEPWKAALVDGVAPEFVDGWKSTVREEIEKRMGISEPETDLRIRTKIDEELRAAEETKLFAVGYRRPDTHDFLAFFDLPDLPPKDQDAIAAGLTEVLRYGLGGLGRGGAHGFAHLEAWERPKPLAAQGRLILTLQTAAPLRKPEPGRTGDVTEAYRAAFAALGLGVAYDLKAVFLQESLRGGGFMARRLPQGVASYAPWLMTRAGSVFAFDLRDRVAPDDPRAEAERKTIHGWLTWGLPVPPPVLAFHGMGAADPELYRYCPYLRENGYGEIAERSLDRDGKDLHVALSPAALGVAVETIEAVDVRALYA